MGKYVLFFSSLILAACSGYEYMGGEIYITLPAHNAALAGEAARSFEETARKRCVNGVLREEWNTRLETRYDDETRRRHFAPKVEMWIHIRGKLECRTRSSRQ